MNAPRIGVLALQGDVVDHCDALASVGTRPARVRRPDELAEVDALVIPGGESTTIDKLSRAFGLTGPIRERIAAGMPVYGSCAGMIMLADRIADARVGQETFGGIDMTVRRNAFGRQVESFEEDLAVEGLPGPPLRAVFIRAPWVEEAGPGVQTLATLGRGPAAGRIVAVRSGNLLATSFHPEVGGDDRIHQYFADLVTTYLRERS